MSRKRRCSAAPCVRKRRDRRLTALPRHANRHAGACRVAGSSALSREDLQPALEDMQRKLMERNVAEEIAVQVLREGDSWRCGVRACVRVCAGGRRTSSAGRRGRGWAVFAAWWGRWSPEAAASAQQQRRRARGGAPRGEVTFSSAPTPGPQVCESVAQSLVGQKLSSFTGVKTFVLRAFEDSLSGILNKRAVDVLHDVQVRRLPAGSASHIHSNTHAHTHTCSTCQCWLSRLRVA